MAVPRRAEHTRKALDTPTSLGAELQEVKCPAATVAGGG